MIAVPRALVSSWEKHPVLKSGTWAKHKSAETSSDLSPPQIHLARGSTRGRSRSWIMTDFMKGLSYGNSKAFLYSSILAGVVPMCYNNEERPGGD